MIDGIRIKVCGLTTLVDAEFADRCGVDYLGFILHLKSPRCIALESFQAMAKRLPERRKVAVSVEPSVAELSAMAEAGFDFFQVHFRPEIGVAKVAEWAGVVGASRLWLAPKLPPAADVPPALLPFADYFLLDTFHAEKFGGTGATGDWPKFARHQSAHSDKWWVLSGGLGADNIGDALRATGAKFVDVNSGVESAPGVKDHAKLKSFIVRLHEAVAGPAGGRAARPPAGPTT